MLTYLVDNVLPKRAGDTFSFLFLNLSIFATFVFEVSVVIQAVHGDPLWPKIIHMVLGMYIVHVILGNLLHLIKTDTSIRTLVLPSTLDTKNGWRYCTACEANCPPRSYHCHICGVCILRRDHHCAYAGVCVGYKNSRYFMSMLLGIAIGGGYATVLNNMFIWQLLGGFSMDTFLKHAFPVIFYAFGSLNFRTAVFCLVSVTDFCGCLFALGLFLYHGSMMMHNQTNFEKSRRITIYDLKNWKTNLEEVLGDRWYLTWISPLVKSSLPRDGIYFPTKEEHHLLSNKTK